VGDSLLIDDGKVALIATAVDAVKVVTQVVVPGAVSNNKGINLPGVAVNVPALSEKDEDDLRWAMRRGVDLIALSFVRDAADIRRVHEIMDEEGRRVPVIAKIEKPQAVEHLHEIIDAFDAIMVARGDLGVELPLEEVPIVQKRAIELARRWAKPVIVATQVLESMIDNPRPTRAEASDCANAVLDGADAVMLSGETSVGKFPIDTVKTMARIIESTEEHGLERVPPLGTKPKTRGGAITRAAVEIADQLDAKYICTFTQSGDSARRLSRLRPTKPVFAFTPVEHVRNQLAMAWGIQPMLVPMVHHTDEMTEQVDRTLLENRLVSEGDLVVIAAGSPPGQAGSTNSLKVHKVGDLADFTKGGTQERSNKEKVGPWPTEDSK
jgi:pyruvate kinase